MDKWKPQERVTTATPYPPAPRPPKSERVTAQGTQSGWCGSQHTQARARLMDMTWEKQCTERWEVFLKGPLYGGSRGERWEVEAGGVEWMSSPGRREWHRVMSTAEQGKSALMMERRPSKNQGVGDTSQAQRARCTGRPSSCDVASQPNHLLAGGRMW